MALLIDIKHPEWLRDQDLRNQLRQFDPGADIRLGADPGKLEDIEMLTVSSYYPREALRYPNLKLIQKTGAGVNNILCDPDLPRTVQVARLSVDTSSAEMAEYALAVVLQEQRHLRQYRDQQADSTWLAYAPRRAAETRVAVLGLGRIGVRVAGRFVANDFQVVGWSRTPKTIDGVVCCVGSAELRSTLANSDYVVAVLPSTPATRGMFNRDLFTLLQSGAFFINLGRGDLVDEADLIIALDQDWFAGAILDVMSVEPLPSANALWQHPKVQLTPHVSGYHLGDAIADIAENYRRLEANEPLINLIDRDRGY